MVRGAAREPDDRGVGPPPAVPAILAAIGLAAGCTGALERTTARDTARDTRGDTDAGAGPDAFVAARDAEGEADCGSCSPPICSSEQLAAGWAVRGGVCVRNYVFPSTYADVGISLFGTPISEIPAP